MTKEEKVFEVLQLTNLNWTVNKEQLNRQDGTPTNSFGIFRNDNDIQLNSGVKEGYQVYQNYELIHDMIDIVGENLQINSIKDVRGGQFQEGKKVFVSFPLESVGIGQNNDVLKRYITFMNSHDGSSSVCLGSSNEVLSCSNSFFRIARGLNKVRHTQSMQQKINALKSDLKNTLEQELILIDAMKELVNKPINSGDINSIVSLLNEDNINYEDLSSKKKNSIMDLETSIMSEISQKGSDMWALFNGMTYFTNHKQSKEGLKNVMIGSGSKLNNKALNYAINK